MTIIVVSNHMMDMEDGIEFGYEQARFMDDQDSILRNKNGITVTLINREEVRLIEQYY